MSDLRDPLLDAIHAAGEVPPPPGRDAAFARAMQPVLMPSRRRLNRSVIALFAAALLAVPAAVFAERASHTAPATITPITFEKPDPHSSILHEADDTTVKREDLAEREHAGTATGTDDRSGTSGKESTDTEHAGSGTTTTDDHSGPGPGGGDDAISTPAPTPIPSPTMGSDGSPDGGLPDGDSSGSPDGGSPGPH